MIVFLLLLFILTSVSARTFKQAPINSYNSISQTQAIKGFFVITIFFSHFCSYVHLNQWFDTPVQTYCSFLGQLMVAPFFLYSGFGIFESINAKGFAYIINFPKKRILKTLLHFDFAVLLFLLLDCIIQQPPNLFEFLLSLFAWESIGNSNWFIFAILCAYLFTYIGIFLSKRNRYIALVLISTMSFIYILCISRAKPSYWFDTILAFPAGCLLSLYKTQIYRLSQKSSSFIIISFISLGIFSCTKFLPFGNAFVNSQLALISFCALVVLLSSKIQVNGRILNWFGANVFSIYILQRIPMNFFSFLEINKYSVYLFFILSFICTLILSILFSKWNDFFDQKFLN